MDNDKSLHLPSITNTHYSTFRPELNELVNQKEFSFDNVTITSNFNSANLVSCTQTTSDSFYLQIGSDCQGKVLPFPISSYKVWFYFGVKSSINQTLKITIENLNNFIKLFRSGYRIAYKELDEQFVTPSQFENSYTENEEYQWKRMSNEMTAILHEDTNLVETTFSYSFPANKYILFAFCFPWSYEKNIHFISYLSKRVEDNQDIYFHSTVLTQSKEKRDIHLITITSKSNVIKNEFETKLIGLFPNKNLSLRTQHDKPIIFISARVHPGETPGAFAMNGILKLLTDSTSEEAKLLRKNFVFKIIPIINVDGVSSGHFRLDRGGFNLNRCYLEPDPKKDPEIYAIKKVFMGYANEYKVRYYFDLHADMNVRGVYAFGNALPDFSNHVENVLFPFIFNLKCSNVNWERCTFSEGCMKSKFKYDNHSKEATSRVNFYITTGIIHTYTIESSYFRGNFHNKKDESLYTVESFEKTGKDLLLSVLDYEELTLSDSLLKSVYKNVAGARSFIAENVQRKEERFKYDLKYRMMVKEINQERRWTSMKDVNDKYGNIRARSKSKSSRRILLPIIRQRSMRRKEEEKGKIVIDCQKYDSFRDEGVSNNINTLNKGRVGHGVRNIWNRNEQWKKY